MNTIRSKRIFTDSGGNSDAFQGKIVTLYSDLPPVNIHNGEIWVVTTSTGTKYLPAWLTGDYYPKGFYLSDGISWNYLGEVPYQASQSTVNSGIVTDEFVSPNTLKNSTQWNTKQDTLISTTNIKSINGNSILGSGDLVISGISGLTTNELVYGNSATTIASLSVVTYPNLTELSYVKGITSSIQTQINNKIELFLEPFSWDGGGGFITTGNQIALIASTSGTITGWSINAFGTNPTCTIDVYKIAYGTVNPTVANSIATTKPALVTDNVIRNTSPNFSTLIVTAGDIIIVNLDAVSNVTKLKFKLETI